MAKYTIEFKDNNPYWSTDAKYNKMLLCCQKARIDNLLTIDGTVTLKDALKIFGFFVKDISPDILCRRWYYKNNTETDIEIIHTDYGARITFDTDD